MTEKISAEEIRAQDRSLLRDIEDALANCMKCGNCMEVCPLYKELGRENAVARGKLALMEGVLQGTLQLSASFDAAMAKCVSCKACAAKCPCDVPADELILRGRQAIVKARGLHPIKQKVFALLKNRRLFDFTLRMAGLFGPLSFKKLPGKMAAVARFPMPGMDKRRITAPFATTPLRSQHPETLSVAKPRLKVLFFTGCTINYIYTDIGNATLNVLAANNIEVTMPKLQHCCGTPVYMSGDLDSARTLARHNIEVFSEQACDYVIAACGSCAEAFKLEYPHLFPDDEILSAKAKALAAKTYEISEFLVDIAGFDRSRLGQVNRSVTMHDPCHMARGIKVTRQPRELLQAIPGLRLVEMKEPARCCGAGGSFSLANYELSRKINDRKIADIVSTGADLVATSCGSCRMHICDGLIQNGQASDALHVVQLLDQAYQAGKK